MVRPWNKERTKALLRFAEKNSGPWDNDNRGENDEFFEEIPCQDDVNLVISAPMLLSALEDILGESAFTGLPESKQEAIYEAVFMAKSSVSPMPSDSAP